MDPYSDYRRRDVDFGLAVLTDSTTEPVTLAEAKAHLRVTHADEDELISRLIRAARSRCEEHCRRQFGPASRLYWLSDWVGRSRIQIPRPSLISITSVKYIDMDGVLQTLPAEAYRSTTYREPAIIEPAWGTTWPAVRRGLEAVQIRYQAGWSGAMPEGVRAAVLLTIGDMYEHRESFVTGTIATPLPLGANNLLAPYVCHWSP